MSVTLENWCPHLRIAPSVDSKAIKQQLINSYFVFYFLSFSCLNKDFALLSPSPPPLKELQLLDFSPCSQLFLPIFASWVADGRDGGWTVELKRGFQTSPVKALNMNHSFGDLVSGLEGWSHIREWAPIGCVST